MNHDRTADLSLVSQWSAIRNIPLHRLKQLNPLYEMRGPFPLQQENYFRIRQKLVPGILATIEKSTKLWRIGHTLCQQVPIGKFNLRMSIFSVDKSTGIGQETGAGFWEVKHLWGSLQSVRLCKILTMRSKCRVKWCYGNIPRKVRYWGKASCSLYHFEAEI